MNACSRVAPTAFGRRRPPAGMAAPQSEWLDSERLGPEWLGSERLGDLKLFATGWAAGLVFFGTLLA